eukprot:jgi/Ulvmu1/1460/UM011_0190.1
MASVTSPVLQLHNLPLEVLVRICHFLPGESIAALQQSKKALNESFESVWKDAYAQRWCCVGQAALEGDLTWKRMYSDRHTSMQTLLQSLHSDLSRTNCPQQSPSSKWRAFRLWDEPAVVQVSIRDWQAHQQALQSSHASLEDLLRLVDLHAGPLAPLAAMQFLITRICMPSLAVAGSDSAAAARTQLHMLDNATPASAQQQQHSASGCSTERAPLRLDSGSTAAGVPCVCSTATGMCCHCAWQALQRLEARVATSPSGSCPVFLRTWRLGELQPLAGWRTRDRMSSVSFTMQELLTRPWAGSSVPVVWAALHRGCQLDVTNMVLEYALPSDGMKA